MDKGYYDYAKYGSIGLSWVLTTVVYFYLFFKGGQWLDYRFGTYPVFLVTGLILATALSLKTLISELLAFADDVTTRKDDDGDDRKSDRE